MIILNYLLFLLFTENYILATGVDINEKKYSHIQNGTIPLIMRGAWFSWENGRNTLTNLMQQR
ncbi:hypothetical protein NQ317_002382 [Molorchus minor]|uniref:Uncharacterized protein n=1 Tax=Molorchus minor TaxID=1323400 RepID=A0ABQ9J6S0_9CUCU|nr:hypothetical protein NQ317_002382 [Molorchus minor]